MFINGCSCPGYTLTFECTVVGRGATVWRGSAFDCVYTSNTILLFHSRFATPIGTISTCNNGAIVGRSLRVENNSYTSQLNVTVSRDLIGKSVTCVHDNGTYVYAIGSSIIPGGELTVKSIM